MNTNCHPSLRRHKPSCQGVVTLDGRDHYLGKQLAEWDARRLVIDPLMAYLATGVDSSKDHEIRRCLLRLKRLAERGRCMARWIALRLRVLHTHTVPHPIAYRL
jgi:hypothetical protein